MDDGRVYLNHLGRALSVYPAEAGRPFAEHCTVKVRERIPPGPDNNWRAEYVSTPEKCYWFDRDSDGRQWFCTFGGYFHHIYDFLSRQHGDALVVSHKVDHGVPEPDLEFLKFVQWRPNQPAVVAAILAHRGGQILCDVGFGKTFIIGKLVRAYQRNPELKIVVTVAIVRVAKDIYRELQSLGVDVGMVGGGSKKVGRVTVAVSHSLRYAPYDANIVFVDEAHKLLTPNFMQMLNKFYRAKMFGFTASPEGRHDNRDGYMEAIFGPVLADVTYQENVDVGSVVPLRVRAYEIRTGPDVSSVREDVRRNRVGIWRNATRNAAIAQVIHQILDEMGHDTQLLVYVDKTEHAFLLGQLLPGFAIAHGPLDTKRERLLRREGVIAPDQTICTSKMLDQMSKQFSELEIRHAICTTVWNTGVNFWDLEVFVRADGTASKIVSTQAPGRLSRLGKQSDKTGGLVVDFTDRFSKVFYNRWLNRRRVYDAKGWNIEQREL